MAGDRLARFPGEKTVRMAATRSAPAGVDVKLTRLLDCGI